MLSKEAGPSFGQWVLCDNIDLSTVLQEYESYCFIKFKKLPRIAKKRAGNGSFVCVCVFVCILMVPFYE